MDTNSSSPSSSSSSGPLYWATAREMAQTRTHPTEEQRMQLDAMGAEAITFSIDDPPEGYYWVTETLVQAATLIMHGLPATHVWTRGAAKIMFGEEAETWPLPQIAAALIRKFGAEPRMPVVTTPAPPTPPAALAEAALRALVELQWSQVLLTLAGRLYRASVLDQLGEQDVRLLKSRSITLLGAIQKDGKAAAEAWCEALAPIKGDEEPPTDEQLRTGLYL